MMHLLSQLLQEQCGLQDCQQAAPGARHLCVDEPLFDTVQDNACHCSRSVGVMRALHIEGLPVSMTAAKISELMTVYGPVQYAEAAPEMVKDETGMLLGRKLHCYVVFTDHQGACLAKRTLQPKQPADQNASREQALRVRFAKPQSLVATCTPAFRAFVNAQWTQAAAVAKANPEYKKPACKVNALFISKLHQHITNARLVSLFGRFGKMIACEVQYHSDGRSAGHAVVIYETIEDAEASLASCNGYRLEGRAIEVTPLRLKKLPSKLEHLKNRIKRQPVVPGEQDQGSEDGSGIPLMMMAGLGAGAANGMMANAGLMGGNMMPPMGAAGVPAGYAAMPGMMGGMALPPGLVLPQGLALPPGMMQPNGAMLLPHRPPGASRECPVGLDLSFI